MDSLPYIDAILNNKEKDKHFERNLHVHWGFWDDPGTAVPGDYENANVACEQMSERILAQADLREGMRLADVGCGFGGTINSINERYSGLDVVGLNIDPRQIEVARNKIQPRNDNEIKFITGDACDLPFEDETVDTLLAVECIFHFPDREKFISEAQRVLKPGGRLIFSDFVPNRDLGMITRIAHRMVGGHYGGASRTCTLPQYRDMLTKYGFDEFCVQDITKNVMPTYDNIYERIRSIRTGLRTQKGKVDFKQKARLKRRLRIAKISTKILELSHRFNLLSYMILGYEKKA